MNKRTAIALVSAGLVAGLVLGTAGISLAATGSTNAPATSVTCAGLGVAISGAGARLVDVVAKLTGLSTTDIAAKRAEGVSLAEIAESEGVSRETVLDEALAARKALLDAKVADGTITQEQADLAYDRMSERLADRVNATETGRPAWAGGAGCRGMGAGGGRSAGCGACVTND
jgi:predicted DNA-binding protein YlxM (UPF0122 family)